MRADVRCSGEDVLLEADFLGCAKARDASDAAATPRNLSVAREMYGSASCPHRATKETFFGPPRDARVRRRHFESMEIGLKSTNQIIFASQCRGIRMLLR